MKYCLRTAISFFFLGVLIIPGLSQNSLYTLSGESNFSIEGSSTLHDWKAEAQDVKGEIQLPEEFQGANLPPVGSSINQLNVKVAVASMDGGKEVMNGKMHRALQKDTHPFIQYELTSAKVSSSDNAANQVQMATEGKVTIAGVTQTITMTVKGKYVMGTGWEFSGSQSLSMSDYNIEPPTAMFGQIVTGDEVSISFNLIVNTQN